jgi:hypothetical protein
MKKLQSMKDTADKAKQEAESLSANVEKLKVSEKKPAAALKKLFGRQ